MHSRVGNNSLRPPKKPRDARECYTDRPRRPREGHLMLHTLSTVHWSAGRSPGSHRAVSVPESTRPFQKQLRPLYWLLLQEEIEKSDSLSTHSLVPWLWLCLLCSHWVQLTRREGGTAKCFCKPEDLSFYRVLLLISCTIQGTAFSFSEPLSTKEFGFNHLSSSF